MAVYAGVQVPRLVKNFEEHGIVREKDAVNSTTVTL
jgi:hypothetical protein